jgi:chromosome segregation ATPase
MKQEVKTLSQNTTNGVAVVKREVTETYNTEDLIQKKAQLQYQQQNIVNQINTLKTQYDECTKYITEVDDLLTKIQTEIPTV